MKKDCRSANQDSDHQVPYAYQVSCRFRGWHTAGCQSQLFLCIISTSYQVNHTIKVLEPGHLQHSRIHVIFEMAVIEGQPNTVEPKACKEFGVIFREEVFEELVEEVFLLLFAQHSKHSSSMLKFVAWVAGDEVFLFMMSIKVLNHLSRSCIALHTMFIHPPRPAPRKVTALPSLSTTFSPSTRSMPLDILADVIQRSATLTGPQLISASSGIQREAATRSCWIEPSAAAPSRLNTTKYMDMATCTVLRIGFRLNKSVDPMRSKTMDVGKFPLRGSGYHDHSPLMLMPMNRVDKSG